MSELATSGSNTPTANSNESAAHVFSVEELIRRLGADADRGLSETRAEELRSRSGFNELAEAPAPALWRRFLSQFNSPVIWILLIAAVIASLLGEWTDALAILAIVVLNGLLGFFQEERAGRSLAALQMLSAPLARVLRGGELRHITARELVPGDRIELEAGDHVPADARLIEAFGLRVQEAALTGESAPTDKDVRAVLTPTTALGDRRNMVFSGTVIAAGKASAVVVATGMGTELGRIAGMLQRHDPEPTPLQKRLAELGKVLGLACLAIVAVVFVVELAGGGRLIDVFLLSVSLAVAAVPEGLPAIVTVSLALGLQRMVRRNALVRRLPSVETLGSVTVICSDKTGTLTRNEMTVREIIAEGRRYHVTGVGYAPRGEFLFDSGSSAPRPVVARAEVGLVRLLTIAARCNHAVLRPRGDESGTWEIVGDPTEGALLTVALKAGVAIDDAGWRLLYEIPFDSERKAMSVVVREGPGAAEMFTKGALEIVVRKCGAELHGGQVMPLTDARREEIEGAGSEMAARALRVLAFAYREVPEGGGYEEADLVFVGLTGMIDPPREEAKEAVARCRGAGIRPVMITGDHPATAVAVARELGIAGRDDAAITGVELDALADDELAARVDRLPVYARVTAEHKLRVVRAWKARGQVVAMTGDGVNDAPAVRAADIGIAMGLTGTDVTREASAMVLTDDNFASIVDAVEEGRGIYDNIRKVLVYLLSCNVGEILLILVAGLLGWPAPLLPVQLLWINLVTDGLPALALALEPPEPGVMRRKPRPPGESILSARLGLWILLQGALVGFTALAAFGILYAINPDQVGRARTMAFCVLVYGELLRALAARSETLTLFRLGFITNPYLIGAIAVSALLQLSVVTLPFARPVFETVAHFGWEWGFLVLFALFPVTVIEVAKLVRARLWPPLDGDNPQLPGAATSGR